MNLYVHFPFCRSKCAYCALRSRAGVGEEARRAYVARLVREVEARSAANPSERFSTVYFGGGTPLLCELDPLFAALAGRCSDACEFTVEFNPRDVTVPLARALRSRGVNRVSMGFQAFDEATLRAMGRAHGVREACRAFGVLRAEFPRAGFDLICGWPGGGGRCAAGSSAWRDRIASLAPDHVSVYSLIREPGTPLARAVRAGRLALPSDDAALDEVARADAALRELGFARYEISNWSRDGAACRHNLACWRGEDYAGVGEGAHGREGQVRTVGLRRGYRRTRLTAAADQLERALFALRLAEGLDLAETARRFPALARRMDGWRAALDRFAELGAVRVAGPDRYALTARGTETCDAVLAELV